MWVPKKKVRWKSKWTKHLKCLFCLEWRKVNLRRLKMIWAISGTHQNWNLKEPIELIGWSKKTLEMPTLFHHWLKTIFNRKMKQSSPKLETLYWKNQLSRNTNFKRNMVWLNNLLKLKPAYQNLIKARPRWTQKGWARTRLINFCMEASPV